MCDYDTGRDLRPLGGRHDRGRPVLRRSSRARRPSRSSSSPSARGRVAIPIARETGKQVIGIDRSPAMLAVARERAGGLPARVPRGRHARVRAGGAGRAHLSARPARSSIVRRGHDKRRVFERVAAALKPGGRFAWNVFAFSHVPRGGERRQTRDAGAARGKSIRYVPADNRIDLVRDNGVRIRALVGRRNPSGKGSSTSPASRWRRCTAGSTGEPFDGRRREFVWVAESRVSEYDAIAGLYDPWSASVVEDISLLRRRGAAAAARPGRRARRRHRADRDPDRDGRRPRDRRRLLGGHARRLRGSAARGRRRRPARPAAGRPAQAARRRARPARHVPVPRVPPPATGRERLEALRRRASCSSPAAA